MRILLQVAKVEILGELYAGIFKDTDFLKINAFDVDSDDAIR